MIVKYGLLVNGVLVVALVGIILIAYLVVAGSIPGCGCESTTVQFTSPKVSIRTSGEDIVWDATIHIDKLTPKDERVRWVEVRVVVKSSVGSILNEGSELHRYDPSAITDGGFGSADVQFWFEDVKGDGVVGPGDNIMVTGMDALQYEGALVQMLKDGKIIGDTSLPTYFE